jgi:hypothetical protein
MAAPVLSEIMALERLSLAQLQQKHIELFSGESPSVANKVFLKRRLAYRLQEAACGGLSAPARSRLDELMQQPDLLNRRATSPAVPPAPGQNPARPLRDRRLPIPGTVLTKIYKGVPFQVKVLAKGVEFQGKTYRSLTAVAQIITGMHWNGYLFFGL